MKKVFLITILFAYSIVSLGFSHPLTNYNKMNENIILNDIYFAEFFKKVCKDNAAVYYEVNSKGGSKLIIEYNKMLEVASTHEVIIDFYKKNNLNTDKLINSKVELIKSYQDLLINNKAFASLTPEQQKKEVENLFNIIKSENFALENPNNVCLAAYNEIKTHTNLASRLSKAEAIDCIKDATIGVIASIGGLAGTLIGMGAIGAISAGAISNAILVGGFAIAGTALAYMIGCILWDAWD